MCQNGNCAECRKMARDASMSARWQPPKVKPPKSSNRDDDPPTEFLDFSLINFLLNRGKEGNKNKEEE